MRRLPVIVLALACCMTLQAQNRTQSGWPTMQKKFPMLSYREMPSPSGDLASWSGVSGVKSSWGMVERTYLTTKVPDGPLPKSLKLEAWRGERVMAQALVWSDRLLEDLTYSLEGKGFTPERPGPAREWVETDAEPSGSGLRYSLGWVRNVMFGRDAFLSSLPGDDPLRGAISEAKDSLLIPDCIDAWTQGLSIGPRQTRALWLEISVPEGTSGTFKGHLVVRSHATVIARLPFSLRVVEKTLPALRADSLTDDLLFNPFSVSRYCHMAEWKTEYLTPWCKEHFIAMRPMLERLASIGQTSIAASVCYDPFEARAEDAFGSMVSWVRSNDGWRFSYNIFDRWVGFAGECGLGGTVKCYGLGRPLRYLDQTADMVRTLQPGDPAYIPTIRAFLADFKAHMSGEAGRVAFVLPSDSAASDLLAEEVKALGFRTVSPAGGNFCSWPLEPLFDARFIPASLKAAESQATAGTAVISAQDAVVSREDLSGSSPATLPFLLYPGNRPSIRLERLILSRQNAAR